MIVTVAKYRELIGPRALELYKLSQAEADDLAAAAAEVDASAAVRYALPLIDSPMIQQWIVTLAEGEAWSRTESGKIPDSLDKRLKNVRSALERLADGKLKLEGQPEATSGVGAAIVAKNSDPVFGREKMDGF